MLKYKHGRGRCASNAGLSVRHRDRREKNNTRYNRLQKIIIILSVCLTIEAFLYVYGGRGKTGRHTGSWLQRRANPQLVSIKKERKSVQYLTNKCTLLFIPVHRLSRSNPLSLRHNADTFELAVPGLNNAVESFHTSSRSRAYNYRTLAHDAAVNER